MTIYLPDRAGRMCAVTVGEQLPMIDRLSRYPLAVRCGQTEVRRVLGVPADGWLRAQDKTNALWSLVAGVLAEGVDAG